MTAINASGAEARDEASRVAAVRRLGLLDTPAEERFDVFTRLAASVTHCPISLLSLVDADRVWLKSIVGMPAASRSVPRAHATCPHVLETPDDIQVIADMEAEPRWATSPFVAGIDGMRFYAGAPLRAQGGEVVGTLCVVDRVPRQADAALLERLRDLAIGVSTALRIHEMAALVMRDALTGLGNRRMFDEALAGSAAVLPGQAVGVLLADLDRFKTINEMLGHSGGDAVLHEVGRRLVGVLRSSDIAARLEGDAFGSVIMVSDDARGELMLYDIAQRVRAAVCESPVVVEGHQLRIECSIGIAIAAGCGAMPDLGEAVLRAADVALRDAKRGGRNRVVFARELGGIGIGSKQRLAAELRHCLAQGGLGLSLLLQPLVSGRDGTTVTGFEALVRWQHASFGVVPPSEFVPVAERMGLTVALDTWVLREACRLAAMLPDMAVPISVNITPTFFIDADFIPVLDSALASAGLQPRALCIELTERVFLQDMAPAKRASAALAQRGVAVALDDFGAGHASFGYLAEIVVRKVKIDGSLVASLGDGTEAGGRAAIIVRGVAAMARELGLGVVAECVETEAQLAVLREIGCDEVQGWLTGRPAPIGHWQQKLARLVAAA